MTDVAEIKGHRYELMALNICMINSIQADIHWSYAGQTDTVSEEDTNRKSLSVDR